MGSKIINIFFLFFVLISCNVPYASFENGDKKIYLLSNKNKFVLTTKPTIESSNDYLIIVDDGDRFDKLLIYVNLCDSSYHVIVQGGVEVVGKPAFTYETIGWYYDDRHKRLEREYSKSDCKFTYYE